MKNITMILIFMLSLTVVAQENYTLLLVDKSGSMNAENPEQDKYIYKLVIPFLLLFYSIICILLYAKTNRYRN